MLASMSEIDRRVDALLVDWSELGVSGLLPTGTVTLLLADVEGSTRLWDARHHEMDRAVARHDEILDDAVVAAGGVRPVEQGEGDSVVASVLHRGRRRSRRARRPAPAARRPSGCRCEWPCTPATPSCAARGTTSARRSSAALDSGPGHGGQVLLSVALERDALPDGAGLVEPGVARLRDRDGRRCDRRSTEWLNGRPVSRTSRVDRGRTPAAPA